MIVVATRSRITQLALGVATRLLLGLRRLHPATRGVLAAALTSVAAMSGVLTPRLSPVGRNLDVAAHELELVQLVLLGLATFWLARRALPSSPEPRSVPDLARRWAAT